MAHLLPASWRRVIEPLDAPVPATPSALVVAPTDEPAKRLEQLDHIVVVMLPPPAVDDEHDFQRLGVRVPAL